MMRWLEITWSGLPLETFIQRDYCWADSSLLFPPVVLFDRSPGQVCTAGMKRKNIRKIHISLFKDDISNSFHEYGMVQNFILKTGHSWQHCMLWTVTHFQSQVTCLSCCAIQSSHFKCNIFCTSPSPFPLIIYLCGWVPDTA